MNHFFLRAFVLTLLLISFKAFPQRTKIDSLSKALVTATDTLKINLLNELAFEYWDFDIEKAYEYSKESLLQSSALGYEKGIAAAQTNIGIYHFHIGEQEKALASYRSAVKAVGNRIYPRFPSYTLSRIANYHRQISAYDSALYYYELSLQRTTSSPSKEVVSTIYSNIGITYLEMENYDSAKAYIYRSLVIREASNEPALKAMSLSEMGRLFLRLENFDSAAYYLAEAKAIGDRYELPEIQIVYSIYSGELEMKKGNFARAVNHVKSSLFLLNEYEYLLLQIRSFYLLGSIYTEIGAYDRALENLLKAESLNRTVLSRKLAAEINFDLGYVFYYQKNLDKALQVAELALEQFQDIGLKGYEASVNNLLGLIELEKKNYEVAEKYFDLGLESYIKLQDKKGLAAVLYNKSYIYLEQGKLEQVLDIQLEALAYEKEIDNTLGIIISYNSLGDLLIQMEAYDLAEEYLLGAQALLKKHPSVAYEEENNLFLARLYFAKSEFKKAYEYLNWSKQNSDSVFSLNSLNKSLELSAIHDLEKKGLEIENLNKDKEAKNFEIQIQEDQLRLQQLIIYLGGFAIIFFALLSLFLVRTIRKLRRTQKELIKAEKRASLGILVAGLSHEINNPLNFIKGGAEILRHHRSNWTEEELQSLDVIDEGISRTSEILKLLGTFRKNKDSEFQRCDLHKILTDCIDEMNEQKPAHVKVAITQHDAGAITEGNLNDLTLLFKELLKNSCQSIQKAGEISILIHARKKSCKVQIIDTGVGIDKKNLNLLENPFFTTKDPDIGKGMGLYLVDYILNEHKGKIHFDSQQGKGTKTTVSLPKTSKG